MFSRTGRFGVVLSIAALSGVLGLAGARALEIRFEDPGAMSQVVSAVQMGVPGGVTPYLSASLAPGFDAAAFSTPWQPLAQPRSPGPESVAGRAESESGSAGAVAGAVAAAVAGSPGAVAGAPGSGPGSLGSAGGPSLGASGPTAAPLPLRLVDAGAVGIDPDPAGWQGSYSHGTGAFHALIDPRTSNVDPEAVGQIRQEWATHVERMAAFGNNAVAVGAFLELMTFEGAGVYQADSPFPARHLALREVFRDLFATAREAGLAGYLRTDMLALTPPLERALRQRTGGPLNTTHPALWSLYAQGLEEVFQALPELEGVVIRIGEAGALYNREGWPYTSRMGVQEPEALAAMLDGLLPTFQRHGKDLILRSWSVGLGGLGHLHTDPALYQRVLGAFQSPNLVVSTKYTRGDYFGFLPLNPTLAAGGHRRLVEFQARREFEGFTAFPNFLGGEHGNALRAHLASNPAIEGTYLWSQEGGPLHSGPRSLYPLHGFWSWIDANVYATSMLARDPSLDQATLAAMWVRETISHDPRVVEGLTDLLLRSRGAVEKGLYIRPFAQRDVRSVGVEVPTMMWIMEWDVVGDWRAVSSTVYRASREELQATIHEGFQALDEVRAMRASLERAAPGMVDDRRLPAMRRSLEYQESLFTALAWWRSTLLSYYGWLEQGDEGLRTAYKMSAGEARNAAVSHMARFEGDLDFPAYDFAPALKALDRHHRSLLARDMSRLLLLGWMLAGVALAAAARPGRRLRGGGGEGQGAPGVSGAGIVSGARIARLAGIPLAIALVLTAAANLWMLMAFEGERAVLTPLAMLLAFPAVLALTWGGPGGPGARTAPLLWPLLAFVLPPLALMAVRGPDLLWFLFWSHTATRTMLLAMIPAAVLGMGAMALHVGARRRQPAARMAGGLLLAVGTVLVILGLALPDLDTLLATLDDPLSFLPMRLALIVAVTAYAGVPSWINLVPVVAGVGALVPGILLLLWPARGRGSVDRAGPVLAFPSEALPAQAVPFRPDSRSRPDH